MYALWEQVHEEYRHPLPSLPNFTPVLDEMGISYQVDELPPDAARGFDSEEEARSMIAHRLYIAPGSDAEAKLSEILDDSLQQESDGIWRIKGSQPLKTCIVSWEPGT